MKKVNFDVEIKSFNGESAGKLKEVVANILQMATTGNPVKMNVWAIDTYKNGFIEIDDADLNWLEDFFKGNDKIPNITKATVLTALQEAKNMEV